MKKLLISLLALLTLPGVGNAQVSGIKVGYCQGEAGTFPSTTDSYFSDMSVQKKTWTSGAIRLKTAKLNAMKGNEIREVNAFLASKLNVDSLAVWVSATLDGEPLSTDTITTQVKGWNTVALTKPVSITPETDCLYIGYSYHQKSTSKAMGCLTNKQVEGYSCFTRSGNDAWKDCSADYTLCVEAIVYGDNLPKYDLTLEALQVQKNYVVDKGKLLLTASVYNAGTVTVNSFDFVCSISGISEVYTVHCDSTIAYDETKTIEFSIAPEAIQTMDPDNRDVTVTLEQINGYADENPTDNALTGNFLITLHSFDRHVLLEEFTTEKCINCPRVAGYVHDAMQESEFDGRLYTMENHVGYYTDSFTASFHRDWEWFFDNEYAPALMYDRHAEKGAATAVTSASSKFDLYEQIRQRLREPAFVSLKVKAAVDEEAQTIHVTVTGARAKEMFTINAPRITVVLTETNLKAISQAGVSTDYWHYNVGRRVNSAWGDVLEWDGDNYTYECTIPYNKSYVMENLGILAFVHDYDATDKTRCEVANSAAITYADFESYSTGIHAATGAAGQQPRYFDLQGRELSAPVHGLNIVVRGKEVTKVMIP